MQTLVTVLFFFVFAILKLEIGNASQSGDLKYWDEHSSLGKEIPIFERLRHRMLWLSEWRRMMEEMQQLICLVFFSLKLVASRS